MKLVQMCLKPIFFYGQDKVTSLAAKRLEDVYTSIGKRPPLLCFETSINTFFIILSDVN